MRKIAVISLFLFQVLFLQLYAQKDTVITLSDCIERAMFGNYAIKIAKNDLSIAKNNINLSPFLPTLSLVANQKQTYSDSNPENSLNLGASLNWTIFDGMKMFASHSRQKELLSQGELLFKNAVQNLLGDVISQYYLIINLHNQEKLYEELVEISKIRYNQALTRYMIGRDSGLEYKQAKIYLNSDSTALLVQQEDLQNAYIELFRMMNVPFDSHYAVQDTIIQEKKMFYEDLNRRMMENNLSLLRIRSGEKVSEMDLKIAQSALYPNLNFSSGYSYYPGEDRNNLNWGFSLNMPIFTGGETSRKIKNARLTVESARLESNQAEQLLQSQLLQFYNTYLNNMRLIEFEQESTEAAYLNLEAAMEKYRLGALSGIEFREIQTSYLNASANKLKAKYRAKISEITLHLLAGDMF